MKVTKTNKRFWECEITTDHVYIEVAIISCLHIGADDHNADLWKKYHDWLLEADNHYAIFLGDIADYSIPTHMPQTMWKQSMNPQEQIDEVINELRPIKDKIIGLYDGNHEDRIWKLTSIDPNRLIARVLDIPYLGIGGYIKFFIGNRNNIITFLEPKRIDEEPAYELTEYTGFFIHGNKLGGLPYTRLRKVFWKHGKYIDFFGIAHRHSFAQHDFYDHNYEKDESRRIIGFISAGFKYDADYEFTSVYPGSLQGASILKLYSGEKKYDIDNSGESKFEG